jgi:uncharacterized glyoxalase superfamily protein PhnB
MTAPAAQLSLVTLGTDDMRGAVHFYESMGFVRKVRATGDEVAFFEAGGVVLALYGWNDLARDARLPAEPRPAAFRGVALAWNCRTSDEVDEVMARAIAGGARMLKKAARTDWGGYAGYFADRDGHSWEVAHNPGFPMDASGRLILPD